jgi:hypothetical protein
LEGHPFDSLPKSKSRFMVGKEGYTHDLKPRARFIATSEGTIFDSDKDIQ